MVGSAEPRPRVGHRGGRTLRDPPAGGPTGWTVTATDRAGLNDAMVQAASDQRICLLGTIGATRLILRRSVTEDRASTWSGTAHHGAGIMVDASNVTVGGISSVHGWAPSISQTGKNIILRNSSTSIAPRDLHARTHRIRYRSPA